MWNNHLIRGSEGQVDEAATRASRWSLLLSRESRSVAFRAMGAHTRRPFAPAFRRRAVASPTALRRTTEAPARHRSVGGLSRATQSVFGAFGEERKEANTRAAQPDLATGS